LAPANVYPVVEEVARLWNEAGPLAEAACTDVELAWRAHYASLVSLAALLCDSRTDAEDVVQEVFVSLQRVRREVTDLEAYLRTAVVNRCRSRHRRSLVARRHQLAVFDAAVEHEVDSVVRLLPRLKPNQRIALVLRFYHDLSMAQVARSMGCNESTARSHVHRGLKALKELLDAE
jgi:RNA polymerase sigma factor (sigma-70 family)